MGGGQGAAMGGEANQVAPQNIDRSLSAARAGEIPGANNELDSRGYLASLDMQLPVRGEEFFFTTLAALPRSRLRAFRTSFMNRWASDRWLDFHRLGLSSLDQSQVRHLSHQRYALECIKKRSPEEHPGGRLPGWDLPRRFRKEFGLRAERGCN